MGEREEGGKEKDRVDERRGLGSGVKYINPKPRAGSRIGEPRPRWKPRRAPGPHESPCPPGRKKRGLPGQFLVGFVRAFSKRGTGGHRTGRSSPLLRPRSTSSRPFGAPPALPGPRLCCDLLTLSTLPCASSAGTSLPAPGPGPSCFLPHPARKVPPEAKTNLKGRSMFRRHIRGLKRATPSPRPRGSCARAADCRGHLKLEGRDALERRRSSPRGRRGLADSPLFAFFHALSFCVELFKREIPGSFMLMCRTKAAAHGRGPGRCREAGVAERGGGLRVSLACPWGGQNSSSFLQTQSRSRARVARSPPGTGPCGT